MVAWYTPTGTETGVAPILQSLTETVLPVLALIIPNTPAGIAEGQPAATGSPVFTPGTLIVMSAAQLLPAKVPKLRLAEPVR